MQSSKSMLMDCFPPLQLCCTAATPRSCIFHVVSRWDRCHIMKYNAPSSNAEIIYDMSWRCTLDIYILPHSSIVINCFIESLLKSLPASLIEQEALNSHTHTAFIAILAPMYVCMYVYSMASLWGLFIIIFSGLVLRFRLKDGFQHLHCGGDGEEWVCVCEREV